MCVYDHMHTCIRIHAYAYIALHAKHGMAWHGKAWHGIALRGFHRLQVYTV